MDALSDILRVVGLTGGVFMHADFTAPWAVLGRISPETCAPFMTPPEQIVAFHYVVEGGFELAIDGEPPCRVEAGEAVMFPHNDMHVFGSSTALRPMSAGELLALGPDMVEGRIVHGGGGARTRLVCGFMGGAGPLEPLLAGLPAYLKIAVGALPGGGWIGHTFTYAAETLAAGEPGAATLLAKVSEVLFVESLRRYLGALPPGQTGWLAGLRDPYVGRALSALHGRIDEDWTVEALARAVNMSRSAFADRFTAIIGQPPMRYLTDWRMHLARQKLLGSSRSIAQIAHDVGYASEMAFTRAFRREHGRPPAAWRRKAA